MWVVDFEYRNDNGPDLVGPFKSKIEAEEWVSKLTGFDFILNYRELFEGQHANHQHPRT